MKVFAVILTLLAATSAFASANDCSIEQAQIIGRIVTIQPTGGDLCIAQVAITQYTPSSECPLLRGVVSHFGSQIYLECNHQAGSQVDGILNWPVGSDKISLY
ncbi:hypothetical protein [Bdellovibrio sp. KM01]|jgi:hypothetical protein|uniref:hypothetical protein n=1 Tax=Bdellovibrio sp. KM01 TaxID=2748865 RepID=UPI0015EA583B|nr:hypothetical protein [Bdellovibrio sp. KM01]QLY24486.1 hypothetical protein HW988_13610 [Bdellovibrio sp. KM01]